jgi:hypothetical protein
MQRSQACVAPAGPAPPRGRPGFAAAAQVRLRGGGAAPGSSSSSSPLLRLRVGEQGTGFPRAARVGESQRRQRRLLKAAVARGTWTAWMHREPWGRVATAAMTGARGLCPFRRQQKEKLGDDDADVSVTHGRSHLAAGGAVGGRRGQRLGRRTG